MLNSLESLAIQRHRQVEVLLQDGKTEVIMPSIQRMQRTMRIDGSVHEHEEKMLQGFVDYLKALEKVRPFGFGGESGIQGMGQETEKKSGENGRATRELKLLGRRAAKNCVELCERGRCSQLWERLAEFVYGVTKMKIE